MTHGSCQEPVNEFGLTQQDTEAIAAFARRRDRGNCAADRTLNPREPLGTPGNLLGLERLSLLLNFLEQRELRVRLLPLLEQRVELFLRTGGVAFLD